MHIATGVFLVLMSMRAASAAIGALIFGAVYAAVAVWGFVDGDDVVALVATDTDDNWLHVGLAVAGAPATRPISAGGAVAATAGRPRQRRFLRRRKEQAAEADAAEREAGSPPQRSSASKS